MVGCLLSSSSIIWYEKRKLEEKSQGGRVVVRNGEGGHLKFFTRPLSYKGVEHTGANARTANPPTNGSGSISLKSAISWMHLGYTVSSCNPKRERKQVTEGYKSEGKSESGKEKRDAEVFARFRRNY